MSRLEIEGRQNLGCVLASIAVAVQKKVEMAFILRPGDPFGPLDHLFQILPSRHVENAGSQLVVRDVVVKHQSTDLPEQSSDDVGFSCRNHFGLVGR